MKLLALREAGIAKQVGVIVFGDALNARRWIEDAKNEGYYVLLCGEYAELYLQV